MNFQGRGGGSYGGRGRGGRGRNNGRGGRYGRGGGRNNYTRQSYNYTSGWQPAYNQEINNMGQAFVPQPRTTYGRGRGLQNQRGGQPPNPVKRFANWEACFSCGFDVEDGHNSRTCMNRRDNHQEGFDRTNWQQCEAMGMNFCRKGMHKTQFPNM